MSILFQALASGSKGNSILVSSPSTSILIDSGLSCRELMRRMDGTAVAAKDLSALIVSHEHRDHVSGIGVASRRFDLPIYLNQGTLEGLPSSVGELAHIQVFQPGSRYRVGDLEIYAFPISHDAREPVAFVIENNGARLGVCTDLGVATHLVKNRLQGCHGLVLESNHDPELLINGPYPWHLKQRIQSRHGHLSNMDTCQLLSELHHDGLQTVILAHLSETNNRPEVVADAVRCMENPGRWESVTFEIALQDRVSQPFEIRPPAPAQVC